MKKALSIFTLVLFTFLVTSCDKYDEGGAKKKSEANLTSVWEIESYLLDGVDNTSSLLITNYNETFADNGTYTRIYKDGGSNDVNEIGAWSLVDENTKINFSGAGAYDLTTAASGVATSSYIILRLTKKELWYSFTSGNATHEFHMKAK